MASKHTIRYIPSDTYSRTMRIRRKVGSTTEPYPLVGYEVVFVLTDNLGVPLEDLPEEPEAEIIDPDDGQVSFFLASALTEYLGGEDYEMKYYIRLSLNTDEVVLTPLIGRLVSDG